MTLVFNLKKGNRSLLRIMHGDSREQLLSFKNQADLIITSPPYADARKHHYESVIPNRYVEWFSSFHYALWNALKPEGSLVLNIKDKVIDGVRHRYVWQTIEKLTQLGWHCIEDYVWHKKSSMPGCWPTRLRDGWEYIFHLAKTTRPYINQEAVKKPMALSSKRKADQIDEDHYQRSYSKSGSGFCGNVLALKHKTLVLPDNVLYLSPVNRNKGHSAVFPVELPSFFIKLLSKPNDLVLDPFAGSGTTAIAAAKLGRRCILIDNKYDYCTLAAKRFQEEVGL